MESIRMHPKSPRISPEAVVTQDFSGGRPYTPFTLRVHSHWDGLRTAVKHSCNPIQKRGTRDPVFSNLIGAIFNLNCKTRWKCTLLALNLLRCSRRVAERDLSSHINALSTAFRVHSYWVRLRTRMKNCRNKAGVFKSDWCLQKILHHSALSLSQSKNARKNSSNPIRNLDHVATLHFRIWEGLLIESIYAWQ